MIVVITGVVTVGGVEYPVQTEVDLPDTRKGKDNGKGIRDLGT
ncbi:MAG TPA: hypothetical protein VNS88_02515 [Nitrospiraceae bacterium]|nr:hypothetical protein [Nitrospiraceae bacterium]